MLISVVCIRHSVYVQQVVHFDFDVAHCSQAMKFMKLGSRPNTFLHCDINKRKKLSLRKDVTRALVDDVNMLYSMFSPFVTPRTLTCSKFVISIEEMLQKHFTRISVLRGWCYLVFCFCLQASVCSALGSILDLGW
ncbi:hypothetical protein P8452_71996 [Trifolium repens]|nr:hypothetical protein P8452_71996 [Trifolium repens]